MNNRTLKFILLVSLALNISMLSAAGYFFYRHYRHWSSPFSQMSGKERHIFENIPLRPDQVNALKEKSEAFCGEMTKKREDIHQLRKILYSFLSTDDQDKEKINRVIDDINKVQKDMQSAVTEHILEEKSLMDGRQQERFFELLGTSLERRKHSRCSSGGSNE